MTALAAKLELGDKFRFHTDLMRSGQDWIIRFSGDPTLTTADLTTLLKAMKAQSGGRIEGDLWLDNSVFSGYERAVGWPWDILGVCYSAQPVPSTSMLTVSRRLFIPNHKVKRAFMYQSTTLCMFSRKPSA